MKIQATALENAAVWAHCFGRKAKQLHQGQIAFADHPAKEKYACWGRRGGKSITIGEVMVPRRALRDPEIVQWIVSLTHDQARIIFDYAANVVLNSPLEAELDTIKWSSPLEMRFRNGSRVYARGLGHDGSTARGFGADVVYPDEAAFIKERIIAEVISPMLTASRFAEIAAISTPNGLNWFYDAYMRGMPGTGDCQSFHMPTWHNPFLNRSHLRNEKIKRTSLAWDVEYGALFVDDQAAQFPWRILEPVIDPDLPMRQEPEASRRYVIGYDPADTQDRSGVVVLDATARPWTPVHIEDISRTGYVAQKREIARLSSAYRQAPVLIDASHTSLMQELEVLGVPITEFRFTNESKRDLIDGLALSIEQRELRLPFHQDLISELKFYRREKNKAGNLVLGAPEDGYDDLATALALAVSEAKTPRSFRHDDVQAAITPDLNADTELFA